MLFQKFKVKKKEKVKEKDKILKLFLDFKNFFFRNYSARELYFFKLKNYNFFFNSLKKKLLKKKTIKGRIKLKKKIFLKSKNLKKKFLKTKRVYLLLKRALKHLKNKYKSSLELKKALKNLIIIKKFACFKLAKQYNQVKVLNKPKFLFIKNILTKLKSLKKKTIIHNKKFLFLDRTIKAVKLKKGLLEPIVLNRNTIFKYKKRIIESKISKTKNYFNLYKKLLFAVFKVGKKPIWENKVSELFNLLVLKLKYTRAAILLKIFNRLLTRVEVKKIQKGRKKRKRNQLITYIPFLIKSQRSILLALKWLFLAALKKKGHFSFQKKLFLEILQLITKKSAPSLSYLIENNTLAYKNKSNIHYRWPK